MKTRRGTSVGQIEALYRAHYGRLATVAGAIAGDADAGHDAVQLAFANALRRRSSFRGEGPLEAWLWRIVVNEARRLGVARSRTSTSVDSIGELATNGAPIDDEFALRGWIATLPERQRSVLFLRYFADLSYAQIAELLEIDVGTVSATLSAAHRKLRAVLSEVER